MCKGYYELYPTSPDNAQFIEQEVTPLLGPVFKEFDSWKYKFIEEYRAKNKTKK